MSRKSKKTKRSRGSRPRVRPRPLSLSKQTEETPHQPSSPGLKDVAQVFALIFVVKLMVVLGVGLFYVVFDSLRKRTSKRDFSNGGFAEPATRVANARPGRATVVMVVSDQKGKFVGDQGGGAVKQWTMDLVNKPFSHVITTFKTMLASDLGVYDGKPRAFQDSCFCFWSSADVILVHCTGYPVTKEGVPRVQAKSLTPRVLGVVPVSALPTLLKGLFSPWHACFADVLELLYRLPRFQGDLKTIQEQWDGLNGAEHLLDKFQRNAIDAFETACGRLLDQLGQLKILKKVQRCRDRDVPELGSIIEDTHLWEKYDELHRGIDELRMHCNKATRGRMPWGTQESLLQEEDVMSPPHDEGTPPSSL